MATTIQPPERFPFTPGEAVYFLPNSSPMKQPLSLIPAVVIDWPWRPEWLIGRIRIHRDDKPRPQKAYCGTLAYRGFCAACLMPAVVVDGALTCPRCGGPAVSEPPPDALIVRWHPIEKWYTPMKLRRAFEHPDWTHGRVCDDMNDTIHGAYTTALARLGLVERDTRSTEDFEGWKADYQLIKLMNFYAMLPDDAAFLATYQQLVRSQESAAPVPPRQPRSESTPDRAHPLRVDWEDSYLLHQMERRPPEAAPLNIVRPADDDAPDDDHGTALDQWLDQQFSRAA